MERFHGGNLRANFSRFEEPMINTRTLALTALAVGSFWTTHANAQAIQGKFRGMYVCEKLPTTRDILRAPLDLIIEGDNVRFARPLFNLNGRRVIGSEMASGKIEGDGKLHLTSEWSYLGNHAQGDYTGILTRTGGTLTGTQTWSAPGGSAPLSRTCTAALVPSADAREAAEEKPKP
jgi:hypothetical protein